MIHNNSFNLFLRRILNYGWVEFPLAYTQVTYELGSQPCKMFAALTLLIKLHFKIFALFTLFACSIYLAKYLKHPKCKKLQLQNDWSIHHQNVCSIHPANKIPSSKEIAASNPQNVWSIYPKKYFATSYLQQYFGLLLIHSAKCLQHIPYKIFAAYNL